MGHFGGPFFGDNMAEYKCVCGHFDDECIKCPKCGLMLVKKHCHKVTKKSTPIKEN
jgi:hypothetical protein